MGGKIKRFFERFFRNSNDEIDGLRERINAGFDEFYLTQTGNFEKMVALQNEIEKNYVDYLADNKRLRDEIASEQDTIKAELEKQRKENIIALKRVVEVLTDPAGNLAVKRKQLL